MTLREIASGKVSFENIEGLPDDGKKPDSQSEEVNENLLVLS